MDAKYLASDRAKELFQNAESEAKNLSHEYVGTEHVLLALIQLEDDLINALFKTLRVSPEKIREKLLCFLADLEKVSVHTLADSGKGSGKSKLPWTPRAQKVLEFAFNQAKKFGDDQVFPEHVMLGLIHESGCVASDFMKILGLTYDELYQEVEKRKS